MEPTHENKNQAINLRALRWAYAQEGFRVTTKAVLITFAIHANERGYTWPGVDHIAFTWGMDRKTVRRQIERLFVRRLICRTKKRCGSTGQVKVYRLPKITWGSGRKSTRLQKEQSGDKAGRKSPISGCEFPPNNDNDEQPIKSGGSTQRDNSIVSASNNGEAESEKRFGKDYQNHADAPAQSHVKWPEFAAWCRSQCGQPTEDGFWKWLCGQKPQWRNKRRPDFDEQGYLLDGKFLPAHEANALMVKNPELHDRFKRAIKRNGRIQACA